MTKKITVAVAILVALAFACGVVFAEEGEKKKDEVKHDFIGAKRCKICHTKDNVYPTWEKTPHATAFAKLSAEQAKDEKCLACHATGKTAKGDVLENVECEACHGPGSDYKTKKIMEDRELAIANGLLIPDEKTCVKCHKAELPKECGEHAKFEFAKVKDKGVHALKAKEAKK